MRVSGNRPYTTLRKALKMEAQGCTEGRCTGGTRGGKLD